MNIPTLKIYSALDAGYKKMKDTTISIRSPGLSEVTEEYHSPNIGMSEIDNCARYLYLEKKRPEIVNGIKVNYEEAESFMDPIRLSRIFRMGFIIEEDITQWLQSGGTVTAVQKKFTDPVVGNRFKGYADLEFESTYIIDIKSMNSNRFNDFKTNGVRETNPGYFTQLNMYEFYNKTPEGFILGYNKDTSEIHVEYVTLDKLYVAERVIKARNVISSNSIFDIVCNRKNENCDECKFSNVCDSLPDETGKI